MTIRTDHKWHNFKYYYELSAKHKRELDWVKDETAPVLVYKGWPFALDEFERLSGTDNETKGWHAGQASTYFSGILIKVSEDGEQYQIGNYYC